jgi:hypothetical protein
MSQSKNTTKQVDFVKSQRWRAGAGEGAKICNFEVLKISRVV